MGPMQFYSLVLLALLVDFFGHISQTNHYCSICLKLGRFLWSYLVVIDIIDWSGDFGYYHYQLKFGSDQICYESINDSIIESVLYIFRSYEEFSTAFH